MDVSRLRLISADSHINEPHDLWYSRLPAELRDRRRGASNKMPHGAWELVIDGQPLGWGELSAEDARIKKQRARQRRVSTCASR
jgi:hypothetical protein